MVENTAPLFLDLCSSLASGTLNRPLEAITASLLHEMVHMYNDTVLNISDVFVDNLREFLLGETTAFSDLSDVFADLNKVDCHNKTS